MFNVWANDARQTLDNFHRSVDRVFDSFFGVTGDRSLGSRGTEFTFTPAIETGWTEEYLNLRAVLPGVSREDVKITVQGNQLVIEGERKAPEYLSNNGGWTQLAYGKFYRAVDLPNGLDLENVNCQLHDGVLDIRIPVAEGMKPRRIQIATESEHKAIAA